jgi:hypothetical protein
MKLKALIEARRGEWAGDAHLQRLLDWIDSETDQAARDRHAEKLVTLRQMAAQIVSRGDVETRQ